MILEIPSKKNWLDKVALKAAAFGKESFNLFQDRIDGCVPLLPNKKPETQTMLVNVFMDSLLGSLVNICASYARDTSLQLEDSIVMGIRAKFSALRSIGIGYEDKIKVDKDGCIKEEKDGVVR